MPVEQISRDLQTLMQTRTLFGPLRALGYVAIVGMAAALVYAAYIALANWAAIAV